MIRIFLFFVFISMMTNISYAQKEWEYKIAVEEKSYTYYVRLIEETADTVKYEEVSDIETNTVLIHKKDGATINWQRTWNGNTSILKRNNNNIEVNSTINGETKSATINVGDGIWIQEMSLSLQWFIKNSNKDKQKFFNIKLEDFSLMDFITRRIKEETIIIGEKQCETIKVKVSLDGWLMSKLWSKSYWFQKKDGLYLKEMGNDGPGTLKRITELVME